MSELTSPLLARLARGEAPVADAVERCELCAASLAADHRHVLDLDSGEAQCVCHACKVLFDRGEAGGDHYRLIPERREQLGDLVLDDRLWAGLGIPVNLAFLTPSSREGRVIARYPSPVGITAALPAPDAWEQLVAANPVLAGLAPDVECLLVHRGRGAQEHWLVPIDDCFVLAARVRERWRGFGGGDAVWDEVARFFDELRKETRWPT